MATRPLLSTLRHRGVGEWLVIVFSVLLIVIGIPILAGGGWLIALGGSWYYLLAGIGLILAGIAMLAGSTVGVLIYLVTWLGTLIWAVWEVGLDGWPLVPRIVAPTLLAILALACLPVLGRGVATQEAVARASEGTARHTRRHSPGRMAAAVIVAIAAGAVLAATMRFGSAEAPANTEPAKPATTAAASAPGATGSDWPAWGGTNSALRYSSLAQINPDNVGKLKRVWTYRTGDLPDAKAKGTYSPETTPIKIGDRLYVCSAKNIIISLDAATGREWWRYDPKVSDDNIPYGATCRGVAYFAKPDAAPDELCATRIIEGTLDARLIAVDAKTGQPCSGFGVNGAVNLLEGIGESVPGWYGNVAAITIVRGIVVMGAQVKDLQAENAPSGVIRGYDAVSGKLAWAWDMCRPDRTGAPPAGETYTRGTPNMWTSAAGDDTLGLVYVPLGNAAGDYYGAHRQACENQYSSSLVAIDVTTGKEAWHFQTVHYDLWDYDLGSQPSLVDFPARAAPSRQ
jgi:quinoprotein glucose dehydrogenase